MDLQYFKDLESFKAELDKRLVYDNEEKNDEYKEKETKILEEYKNYNAAFDLDNAQFSPREAALEKLKTTKLQEIRNIINNDDGFFQLISDLDRINAYKKKKEAELYNLDNPKQTLISWFSSKLKPTNPDELKQIATNKENIKKEIDDLENNIISNITILKRIYPKNPLPHKETQGGTKTKKRRNRNRKKSRKNHKKSKCRN